MLEQSPSSLSWIRREKGRVGALLLGFATLILLAHFSYTIDDARIILRYAQNIVRAGQYAIHPNDPATDGVTSIAYLLLILPSGLIPASKGIFAMKVFGGLCYLLSISMIFFQGHHKAAFLCVLWTFAAFYSVSGMESGLAFLVTTAALFERKSRKIGRIAVAVMPWLRPEASFLVFFLRKGDSKHKTLALAIGAGSVGFFRYFFFGHALPLSSLAKPSDPMDGLYYAASFFVISGLILFPLRLFRSQHRAALAAHTCAIVVAGGDWMPAARLFVPALPLFAIAIEDVFSPLRFSKKPKPKTLSNVGKSILWLRVPIFLAFVVFLHTRFLSDCRQVAAQYPAFLQEMQNQLSGTRRVASADIGWLSLDLKKPVLDLGGVVDPQIGLLPGKHLKKEIPSSVFERYQDVDALVVAKAPLLWPRPRQVDARAKSYFIRTHNFKFFGHVTFSPTFRYDIYRSPTTLSATSSNR